MKAPWPASKAFAFTVFDDTDFATLANVKSVYDFLGDLGFRTTKSVWPLRGSCRPAVGGATCEDRDYLDWLKDIQRAGFEIGYHNATYHTSDRETTGRALGRFRELFGHDPKVMANHVGCSEAIHWGEARLEGLTRYIYRVGTRFRRRNQFRGHSPGDPLFWGDICKQRIKYVRNFVYRSANTLRACPWMPYHDPAKQWVNYWFASSEGGSVRSFCRTLSEEAQEALVDEGGACIMYTHFGAGFCRNGELDRRFRELMERLARLPGWFVPVSELLDYLLDQRAKHCISPVQRLTLEARWFRDKLRAGGRTS